MQFIDLLRHPKSTAPGQRLVLAPWQREIVQRIYGPSDDDGNRLVRTAFILIGRGNRKTALASTLALLHLCGPERRPGGQVILAASERPQARIAFDEVAGIVRLVPALDTALTVRDTKNRIEHPKSGSSITAISADGAAQLGKTPHFVVADEIAVWRGFHLWTSLKTGLNKESGSLAVVITTAAESASGIGFELYQYARKVRDGEIVDPTFLPILYDAPEDLAWDSDDALYAANPGIRDGGFPDIKSLRDDRRMAANLPALRRAFEVYHLNRWQEDKAVSWIEMRLFDECADTFTDDDVADLDCYIAVDLSRSYDLTSIVAAWRTVAGEYLVRPFAFLPQKTFAKRQIETPDIPWNEWQSSGDLIVTPGNVIDEGSIEKQIRDLCERFRVREVAFDPKFAARIASRLGEDGIPVVEHGQSAMAMTPGVTEFQRALLDRKIKHGGHGVLRWCVSNIVPVINDTGLVRFSKGKSTDAIDVAQATAMAIGRAMHAASTSIYATEQRPNGFIVI